MTSYLIIFALCSVSCSLGVIFAGIMSASQNKDPVVSFPSPDGGGGVRWDPDFLPGQDRALASPLISPRVALMSGRGHHFPSMRSVDYRCAESVAVTIEKDRVWVDVDGVNVFRAYRIDVVQVDDRRAS